MQKKSNGYTHHPFIPWILREIKKEGIPLPDICLSQKPKANIILNSERL